MVQQPGSRDDIGRCAEGFSLVAKAACYPEAQCLSNGSAAFVPGCMVLHLT